MVFISVTALVDHRAIARLEVLSKLKNLMTILEIEPAAFQLVA
jgi:hypothetical protein